MGQNGILGLGLTFAFCLDRWVGVVCESLTVTMTQTGVGEEVGEARPQCYPQDGAWPCLNSSSLAFPAEGQGDKMSLHCSFEEGGRVAGEEGEREERGEEA